LSTSRTVAGLTSWERTPDVTRAELGRCVAQEVLADAILLGAGICTCGGDAPLEILVGAIEDLDQE
jgi:hypothetical protein